MAIYILIFITLILGSLVNIYIKKSEMKFIYSLYGIFLTIFVAVRENLGGSDYYVYKSYFDNMNSLFDIKNHYYFIEYEIGYKYFNSIIKIFTNNSFWLFFIIAILTIPTMLVLNYKYCEYPFFTLSFYMYKTFFYTNFIAMRQSIAVAIFLLSIKYIIKGDFKKYTICILIASMFHSSAIILIAIYLVRKINLYKLNLFQIIFIGMGVLIISNPIINIFEYLSYIIGISETVSDKIGAISNVSSTINLHVIEIILIYIIFRRSYKIKSEDDKLILNILVLYFIFLLGFSTQVIFIRISMYFYFIIMIFMCKSLESIRIIKYKQLIIYGLLLVFMLGYIKYIMQFDNGGLIPYRSFLFN